MSRLLCKLVLPVTAVALLLVAANRTEAAWYYSTPYYGSYYTPSYSYYTPSYSYYPSYRSYPSYSYYALSYSYYPYSNYYYYPGYTYTYRPYSYYYGS